MKVGIITIHNSPNYGACLQSFSLYEYVRQLGHEVEIIDLHRPHYADYRPSLRYRPYEFRESHGFKGYIKRILNLAKDAKKLLMGDSRQLLAHETTINPALRQKFDSFNSRIKLSHPYCGIDELYNNPPAYDAYVTGSDQVWNPTQTYCLEPYFLTFVRRGRRISYAPSVGIEVLTAREQRDFRKWLQGYDALSVREHQAQKLLQSISGRVIEQVADPTFLLELDYWEKLAVMPDERHYILLFMLSDNPALLAYARQLAREGGKTLIVLGQVQPTDGEVGHLAADAAGPEEFIGYIAHADMVITDSFHCTVFSILMGTRQFYTYIAPWNLRGSRIRNLLHTFCLDEHILDSTLHQSLSDLESHPIVRTQVLDIYHREQARSRQFLLTNL